MLASIVAAAARSLLRIVCIAWSRTAFDTHKRRVAYIFINIMGDQNVKTDGNSLHEKTLMLVRLCIGVYVHVVSIEAVDRAQVIKGTHTD